MRKRARFYLAMASLGLMVGCGGERIYDLSGNATFEGKPIPAGYIVFEPNSSAGNSGPPGRCKISNGRFDTRQENGRGTIGGPHLVRIVGMASEIGDAQGDDGSGREVSIPLPLFRPYEVAVELQQNDMEMDFDVPAH